MTDLNVWAGWPLEQLPDHADFGEKRRRWDRAKERQAKQIELLDLLDSLVPGSSSGARYLTFNDEVVQRLLQWINAQAEQKRASKHLQKFLRHGLKAGIKDLQWQADLPPREVSLPEESNPLTPAGFINLSRLRRLIKVFEEHLTTANLTKHNLLFGRLIFSAMVLGGLNDRQAQIQLRDAKKLLRRHDEYVWVDFFTDHHPSGPVQNRGVRRWFPDPISLILLAHLPPIPARLKPSTCLRNFLDFLAESAGGLAPMSLPELHSATWTLHHTMMPPFLARYCAGELLSSPWPESVWQRVLLRKQAPLAATCEQEQQPQPPKSHDSTIIRTVTDSNAIYAAARRALHKNKEEREPAFATITGQLTDLWLQAEQSSPLMYSLIGWLLERFKNKDIRRSTAYQQLTSIGRDLLSYLDDAAMMDMEAEDFTSVYEQILENTRSIATRQNKVDQLRRFHAYASELLGLPDIRLQYADEGFFSEPDANILLEVEYQKIFQYLLANKNDSPDVHAQLVMLILGYRCGLRISEVRHLGLAEFKYRQCTTALDPDSEAFAKLASRACTLLIRGDAFNKLKSRSSRRNLPLNLLLTVDELQIVMDYHQRQLRKLRQNASVDGRYLFSEHRSCAAPMDLSSLQAGLHDLMRQVTGDESIRFHHLRHSLATHALHAFYTDDGLLQLGENWAQIQPKLPTRKYLHQLADYLGHSNSAVTMQHYAHNLDLLVRSELWSYSFCHKLTGLTEREQLTSSLDVATCVRALLQISDQNFRHLNSVNGKQIMGWLPSRLKIEQIVSDGWSSYPELEQPDLTDPRSLLSLNFHRWCDFLQRWARHEPEDELLEAFYLDQKIAQAQMHMLMQIFREKVSHEGNSRIARKRWKGKKTDPNWTPSWNIPQPPVYDNLEMQIAQLCYERSLRLLSSVRHADSASTGLQFFFDNYREWNRQTIIRPAQKDGHDIKCFELLLGNVLGELSVECVKELRPEKEVHKLAGHFKIFTLNGEKRKADYGAVFGLLLAYFVVKLREQKENH